MFTHVNEMSYLKPRKGRRLIRAISNGDYNEISEIANKMTKHELNKCVVIGDISFTPLMHAVQRKNKEVAQMLVSLGADVNCKGNIRTGDWDYKQTIPLLLALENYDFEILKHLCEHGANVNKICAGPVAQEEEGGSVQYVPFTTCLREAIKTHQPEAVSLVLWYGAKIHHGETSGCSYLCFACDSHLFSSAVTEVLVCYGSKLGYGQQKKRHHSKRCCERFMDLLYDTLDLEEWLYNTSAVWNKIRGVQTILLSDYTHKYSHATQATSLALKSDFSKDQEKAVKIENLQEEQKRLNEERIAWTKWLNVHISSVSTLKHICRVIVRSYLNNKLHPKVVKLLPIPVSLQTYLLLDHNIQSYELS